MTRIFEDNAASIGNTPLVRLRRIGGPGATLLGKVEGRNPSCSIKCRTAAALIADAEKNGLLQPGGGIIEPTSGNTGIALAYIAAAKGYRLTLTMPETMTLERRRVLAFLGADLALTPGPEGMAGAVLRAEEMAAADKRLFMPRQFSNSANPAVHEATTGPEIWHASGGIDVFVAGVGTGGTVTGVARYLKQTVGAKVTVVAVEPAASPVLTQHLAGRPLRPAPHAIQGIGAGFVPDNLDLSLVDRVETVSNEDSVTFARRLAKEEGILAGISSGAAAAVAARLSAMPEFAGKTIAVVLPDGAERYVSSVLFEGTA